EGSRVSVEERDHSVGDPSGGECLHRLDERSCVRLWSMREVSESYEASKVGIGDREGGLEDLGVRRTLGKHHNRPGVHLCPPELQEARFRRILVTREPPTADELGRIDAHRVVWAAFENGSKAQSNVAIFPEADQPASRAKIEGSRPWRIRRRAC